MRWWVELWDRREAATSLALVRILVGLLVLVDLLLVARHGLVVPLYAPLEAGGLGDVAVRDGALVLYRLFPPTAATAQVAFWACVGAAASFAAGLLSRTSAVVLLLLYAQLSLPVPAADRGIDMLLRNAMMILAFSGCGATLSVDARLRTGRWASAAPVPAWPRYLLILQLVLLYSSAGVQKVATSWLPFDWSALYVAMNDPHFTRWPCSWVDTVFPLTQAGTLATWLWEWAAPVVVLAYWYRDTEDRPGRLRAWFNRHHVLAWYLAVGAAFHLGTHLVMRLGIFPFAVLSLYPAFAHPDLWTRLWRRRSAGRCA